MNSQTMAALNRAYEVFAGYKSDFDFVRMSGIFHSTRELTLENWDEMCGKFDMAVVLYGDNQFRQFLPRLMEWEISGFLPARIFLDYRLDDAKWLEWPLEEVEALRAVFLAWTREKLATGGEIPIDFLSFIGEDLTLHLEMWLEAQPYEIAYWLYHLGWKEHAPEWQWAVEPHVEAALEAEFSAILTANERGCYRAQLS